MNRWTKTEPLCILYPRFEESDVTRGITHILQTGTSIRVGLRVSQIQSRTRPETTSLPWVDLTLIFGDIN